MLAALGGYTCRDCIVFRGNQIRPLFVNQCTFSVFFYLKNASLFSPRPVFSKYLPIGYCKLFILHVNHQVSKSIAMYVRSYAVIIFLANLSCKMQGSYAHFTYCIYRAL